MVCRFELASLENSFAKHHAAAHLTSDAVGFALAMAWAAAAIVRTKSSSEGSGLLACAPHAAFAAAVALAATAHSLQRSTYLKWRAHIIVVLRVLAVVAGIALQFSVASAANTRITTVALGAAMLPLQYFQLTLLPLVWRLRARQHLVLNLASLAAVASCDGRLAAVVLAQPDAAKLVPTGHAGELMTVIAWLAAQVCLRRYCSVSSYCQSRLGSQSVSCLPSVKVAHFVFLHHTGHVRLPAARRHDRRRGAQRARSLPQRLRAAPRYSVRIGQPAPGGPPPVDADGRPARDGRGSGSRAAAADPRPGYRAHGHEGVR